MRSSFFKSKRRFIASSEQLKKILEHFPTAEIISESWNSFEIVIKLQPSNISEVYDVKICYVENKSVKIFIINKKLKIANGRKKLPHIYVIKTQQLCLYSPIRNEWNACKYIYKTIIPWACEWLFFYELWLIDGQWLGGGHDEYQNESQTEIIRDE